MPRLLEILICCLGLVILTPLLLLVALLVKLAGPGPVLFRQERLGLGGEPFALLKFRSMVDRPVPDGPLVTAGGDRRVTPLGRVLRRTKLDELPQLWNVLRGEMSLVGPRPEVPRYVACYPELFALVHRQRPGLTDVCTLRLRREEELLARVPDAERYYVERLLPRKLGASIREGWRRSFWRDLRVLGATLLPVLAFLAPSADFRPLADLHSLPQPASRAAAAEIGELVAGAGAGDGAASARPARVGA